MSDHQLSIFDAALKSLLPCQEFGLPIDHYKDLGDPPLGVWANEFSIICISECRHCHKLNTTYAQIEGGRLIPMSAGSGPDCQGQKCGDKVSSYCYGYFRLPLRSRRS